MANEQQQLIDALNAAISHGGGTIVVRSRSRQSLAESALLRMAPASARKITVVVDPNVKGTHFTQLA